MIISSSARVVRAQGRCRPQAEGANLGAYRGRSLALLRRYFRMSLDIGRLPSLLGREFFRARVTSYHAQSFEDVVILVHDVERCLERLDDFSRALVARIALQEYTWDETAELMDCSRRTIARRFPRTLDRLSEIFLEVGLLQPLPSAPGEEGAPACQEAGETENSATGCATTQ
jgi:hypothetical protein